MLSPEERFAQKFQRRGDDQCWPWKAATTARGYGVFWFQGRQRYAHRVSAFWAGLMSSVRDQVIVRHKCDNPKCVNPAHLETGTQADNINDCKQRDRMPVGESRPNSKLNEKKVRQIRELLRCGIQQQYVAAIFNVSFQLISGIKSGERWGHVK
jgi:hypothetical protein